MVTVDATCFGRLRCHRDIISCISYNDEIRSVLQSMNNSVVTIITTRCTSKITRDIIV